MYFDEVLYGPVSHSPVGIVLVGLNHKCRLYMLDWSEIMGGCNTADTVVRDRRTK